MGSPEFAVPCLEALLATEEVVAVVTQPDKPAGRGLALPPPAVKVRALAAGRAGAAAGVGAQAAVRRRAARARRPTSCVVVAYGKILPPRCWRRPGTAASTCTRRCCRSIAARAPIQWAIIRGERETGVTLMQMDAGMDTGDMLPSARCAIDEWVTAGQLHARLAPLGAELLVEGAPASLKAARLTPEKQDDAAATMAPMLTKETGRVDFAAGARAVRDSCAASTRGRAHTTLLDGELLKLFAPDHAAGAARRASVHGRRSRRARWSPAATTRWPSPSCSCRGRSACRRRRCWRAADARGTPLHDPTTPARRMNARDVARRVLGRVDERRLRDAGARRRARPRASRPPTAGSRPS